MFKTYQRYLIKKFINKFIIISGIFFCLIIILNVLEEISFFKDLEINLFYPYFLTIINSPSTLFEIFPFIFLITTQYLFFELFKKDELSLLKTNGLNNIKIIKILFFLSFAIGFFNVLVFYNLSSSLKFYYTSIKNQLSNDNKYLAMVTDTGLWIKDEIENKTLIIKSNQIQNNFLENTIINEFNSKFEINRTIQSNKIDIKDYNWLIYNPVITKDNIKTKQSEILKYKTNFNRDKIYSIFSNISTLNLFKLFKVKKDYKNLGYSANEIQLQLYKLFTLPFFCGLLTLLSSIIMLNIKKDKSLIFHIIVGILMSVLIYYMNFIFNSLGSNGKIPLSLSIYFPIIILFLISMIGLVRINEK